MQTIKMPKVRGASDATVVRWHKEPGQAVRSGELLAELDAERTRLELAAGLDGVLTAIHAPAGTTVNKDAPLADVDPDAEPGSTTQPKQPQPSEATMSESESPKAGAPTGEVTPVLMPQVGNTMEEGTIVDWKVQPGDRIELGQVIMEVETDKATVEIEAVNEGRLARIVAHEDDVVPIKQPVAYLAEKDEDVDAFLASQGGGTTQQAASPAPEGPAEQKASPAGGAAEVAVEGPQGEVTPVLMPQVGNTMEEGTIIEWKVSEGDRIEEGDILFEVETDKATVEVEAVDAGRLARIIAHADETIPIKQPVAYLAASDEDVDRYLDMYGHPGSRESEGAAPAAKPAPKAPQQAAGQAAPAQQAPTTETGRVKASPYAKKLAQQRGVDLSQIAQGRGPGGRIVSEDVMQAPTAAPAAAQAPAQPAPARQAAPGELQRQPLSKMRKAIARGLSWSKQNIPHFYMTMTVDAGPMMGFYRGEKARYRCSVNDVIILACSRALQEFPAFRSRIEGDELVTFPASNIGIAVGMPEGLVVPVVQNAEAMTLQQLAGETRRVVEAARNGRIEGAGKGVFTISNLGMFDVDEFSAIINPPEAAILAVGAAKETVIVSEGTMRPGREMKLTLSCDHRVVDGLGAAKFLNRLKLLLELPQLMQS